MGRYTILMDTKSQYHKDVGSLAYYIVNAFSVKISTVFYGTEGTNFLNSYRKAKGQKLIAKC